MKLKALVHVEVGQTFLSKQQFVVDGGVFLVEPRLIDTGAIHYSEATRIQYKGKKWLKRGDVLFVSRGKFEAAVFDSDFPAVATNAFFILRPTEQIKSGYLSAFLNSHQAQQHFRRKQKQTTAKFVSKDDLLEMEIPVVPLAKQDDLLHATDSLKQTEQLLSQKSQILKNIREGLFSQIQGASL